MMQRLPDTAARRTGTSRNTRRRALLNASLLLASVSSFTLLTIHIVNQQSSLSGSAPLYMLWLALALATMGLSVHLTAEWLKKRSPDSDGSPRDGGNPGANRRIVKLHRNAERLNGIERELLMRMCRYELDSDTGRLFTEFQICTNRMLQQLEEFREDDQMARSRADRYASSN